jgi:hypothetical protein
MHPHHCEYQSVALYLRFEIKRGNEIYQDGDSNLESMIWQKGNT